MNLSGMVLLFAVFSYIISKAGVHKVPFQKDFVKKGLTSNASLQYTDDRPTDRQNKSVLLCYSKFNITVLKDALRLRLCRRRDAPFLRMAELWKVQPHRYKEESAWRLKEHLQTCLAEIRAFAAEKLKLEFNEKTQIFPVSEGVDYLGWHFYLTDTGKVIRRLRTSNKRRFKRRLKAFQEKYRSGEMDFDAIKRSLSSYDGHLQHGHTWKLKTKIYGNFVLTKAPKGEVTAIPGETPENA